MVSEPLEHSVLDVDLGGRPMEEVYFLRFPSTRLRALCAQLLNCNLRALV